MATYSSDEEGSEFQNQADKLKMDDISDDEFEDAKSTVSNNDLDTSDQTLAANLQEVHNASALFWNNEFKEARKMFKEKSNSSMYHALGVSVFQLIEAIMTFEGEQIATAMSNNKKSLSLNKKFKKKENLTTSLGKMVGLGGDSSLTELEIHAELVYAELHLIHAVLTFIQDENLVSFIKGALHIRRTYQAYTVCKKIVEKKKFNESPTIKHFIGGVYFGSGSFNLLLSLLPARVVSLLEWVGFSCSKSKGFEELQKGYELINIHNVHCGMVLLGYYCFAAIHFGTHDADWVYVDKILNESLQRHKDGVYFLLFAGRRAAIKGDFQDAINKVQHAHEIQEEWEQFSHICYWELMWYNAFLLNWKESLKYAESLRKESNWSKACYTYLCAIFLMQEEQDEKTKEKISNYMTEVGKLRQRLAGKSIPMEKFIARKARKYFDQGKRLVLPVHEMMFVWFGLVMLRDNKSLLEKHQTIVREMLEKYEGIGRANPSGNSPETPQKHREYYFDDHCLIKLLQGTLLNLSGQKLQAELAFTDVVQNFSGIKKDHYLGPFATVELAWIYIDQGKLDEAKTQIKNIKHNYKHYSLESKLHFRMHSAYSKLTEIQSKGKCDESTAL